MKQLLIKGVIGRADDPTISNGEKVFSLKDLENFIAINGNEFEAVIDSPGGSVEEGFKIFDRLKSLEVDTVALSANSIASIIFLAGKNRKVYPKSEMIIHNAWVDAEAFAGEKLNVHTLNELADIFADTDEKILDVYAQFSGEENRQKIFSLMASETDLGAHLALELGFATEVVAQEDKAKAFKNRVITYSQNQLNKIEMDQKEKMTTFEKMLNSLTKAFKVSFKNMVVSTSEGVELFIDGEGDQQFVGKTAFISEEGIPTEATAPEGNHTLADGTVITVGEGGVITEAVEAPDLDAIKEDYEEKMKSMEEEKKAMEEEKEELLAKITNLTEVNESNAKKVEELQKAFIDLKNQVAGDPEDKKEEVQIDFSKLSPAQKARMVAINKAKNQIK
jgi:ATP-dependent protease ClpP protease subunit